MFTSKLNEPWADVFARRLPAQGSCLHREEYRSLQQTILGQPDILLCHRAKLNLSISAAVVCKVGHTWEYTRPPFGCIEKILEFLFLSHLFFMFVWAMRVLEFRHKHKWYAYTHTNLVVHAWKRIHDKKFGNHCFARPWTPSIWHESNIYGSPLST